MIELSGHEKYLVCIGYMECMADASKKEDGFLTPELMAEISSRIEEKFTNNDLKQTGIVLDKIMNFRPMPIIDDIVTEILEEGKMMKDGR